MFGANVGQSLGLASALMASAARYDECWLLTSDADVTLESSFDLAQKDRQMAEHVTFSTLEEVHFASSPPMEKSNFLYGIRLCFVCAGLC